MRREALCTECDRPGRDHYGVHCLGFRPKTTLSDRVANLVVAVLAFPIYLKGNR